MSARDPSLSAPAVQAEQQPPNETGDKQGAADALIGTIVADRYRIDEKLGVGGMGSVYRAEHVLMRKPVAIKVLHREMTVLEEVVKRFEREAIAAGRIDHPNVAVATDFGKLEDGSFYLVLEYIPGRSLTKVMKADGPLAPERALLIARQVASALGAAHAAGIVHRDLKPDNVMLIERGAADLIKVLDFGIAKVTSEASATGAPLTRLGSIFGTPQYMPPEQAAGRVVDHRADLYSLGLVLYEMLVGHPPFQSDDLIAVLTKQMTQPPPPLPETIDPPVVALVMKLLEKEPEARVQTADALVAEIDALLGPVPSLNDPSGFIPPSSRARMSSVAGATTAQTALGVGTTSARLSSALVTLRSAAGKSWDESADFLERPIDILGRRTRVGWLLAGGALLLLAAGAVFATVSPDAKVATATPSASAAFVEPPPDMKKILALAEVGQRDAMRTLEEKPEDERTALEWLALGKGHDRTGRRRAALQAFGRAVELDASVGNDRSALRVVRQAVGLKETAEEALRLASKMGERGGDLLFDVWSTTNSVSNATLLAKTLLDSKDVRKHASPALRVALELRDAKTCKQYKDLLLDAKVYGDERAVRPLKPLLNTRGCGFLGLGDCYRCLRRDDVTQAIEASQRRAAPRY